MLDATGKILGVGLTVTVVCILLPTQYVVPGPFGKIVNVTVMGASDVFEKAPEIRSPTAFPDKGREVVMPEGFVRVHINVVPETLLLVPNKIFVKATPGHSSWDSGVAVGIGILFTVNNTIVVIFVFPEPSVIIHLYR